MDRCVLSLCMSVCECVTACFGFWLPGFVCVCGLVNVCTRRCVCVLQLLFWMLLLVLVLCVSHAGSTSTKSIAGTASGDSSVKAPKGNNSILFSSQTKRV